MATTKIHPPESKEQPGPARRLVWPLVAVAIVLIAGVGIALAILLSNGEEQPAATATTAAPTTAAVTTAQIVPGTPEAFMAGFVAALRTSGIDIPETTTVVIPRNWALLLEWNLALGIEGQFTDCRAAGDATASLIVSCTITSGEEYFHSLVSGRAMTSTVSAAYSITTGSIALNGFPAPEGLVEVEEAFRDWIRTAHPEDESRLFGFDYAGILRFTKESGELHMQYLDEYLEHLATPLSPEDVMVRLAAAVTAIDPERIGVLEGPLDGTGLAFLEWNTALRMDPVFTDCVESSSIPQVINFTCAVTMGEDYFFSVIAGKDLATSVSGSVRTAEGTLGVSAWPPPRGLVETENAFREWIRANHPEDEAAMFGNDYAGVLRFSAAAGDLHTQHLDEYLAYLAENS